MKLHLPKQLFSALLTAITLAAAPLALTLGSNAWGGWYPSDNYSNTGSGIVMYYVDTTENYAVVTKTDDVKNCTDLRFAPGSKEQVTTLTSLTIDNGDTVTIATNPWKGNNGIRDFQLLTLEELVINPAAGETGNGAAGFVVNQNQTVQLNQVTGTLSSVTNAGNLTLGAATVGSVTNTGSLNLRGTVTGTGEGATISGGTVNVEVDALSITNFEGYHFTDFNGNALADSTIQHGFLKGTQTLTVFKNISVTNASGTAANLTNGQYTYKNEDSTFYVNDSWIFNADESSGASAYYVGANGVFEYYTESNITHEASISGDGTLRKSGSGTLTLNTNATLGTFEVAGGKTILTGNLILKNLLMSGGKLEVSSGGVLDLTGTSYSFNTTNSTDFQKLLTTLNTNNQVTTHGEGYIKVDGTPSGDISMQSDMTLRTNMVTTDKFVLHGRSWDSPHRNGHILTVDDGSFLTIGNEGSGLLELVGCAQVKVINNSSLYAGTVNLGYATTDSRFSSWGKLSIDSGSSAKLSNIVYRQNAGNTFEMTNGSVEFTTKGNIIDRYDNNSVGNFVISGGEWVVNENQNLTQVSGLTVSLGNVDMNIAEGKTITFGGNITITGALTHNSAGTLKFADNTSLNLTTTGLDSLRKVGVGVTSADNDGDGFGTLDYYLVNGTGSVTYGAGMNVTVGGSSDGYTFTNGIISSSSKVYVINSTTKNTGNVSAEAKAFHVNKGGVFTLNGDITGELTLSHLLTTTTGEGTLVLGQDFALEGATHFGGTLQIEKGAQLKLGTGQTTSVNVTSFDKIVLNGGEIRYAAKASSINAIEVIQNSHFVVFDTNGETNQLTLGSVSIAGGSTFFVNSPAAREKNSWKQNLYIGSLSGAGKADIYGTKGKDSDGDSQISCVTINSLEDFEGSLSITSRVYDKENNRYKATVNTGTTGADFEKLEFSGFKLAGYDAVFNVQSNTSVDTITADAATLTAGTFKVNLSEGVTLTLGGDTASTSTLGTVAAHTDGNTIHLNETATLNTLSFEQNSGKVTLTGSGVYDLGSNSTPNVSGLTSSGWKGTVKISGGSAESVTSWGTFSELGNTNSWISLSGVQGYLSADVEISNNLILETGTALNIMQGSSDQYQEKYNNFTGSIKGDGEFKFSGWEKRGGKYGYYFSGDTSEWTGQFNNASSTNHDVNVYFEQNGTVNAPAQIFKAVAEDTTIGVVNTSSTNKLNVHIGKSDTSDAVVQFNGIISGVNKLTVNNRASFERSVDVASVEVAQNAVATINDTLNANTVQLGTAATITKAEGATAATMSKVQMNSAGISSSAADNTKGSISNALIDLQNATKFSISDMTLSGVKISAAADTEVVLNNVGAQEVELTSGQFTMANKATVDTEGYTDLLSGITLKNTGNSAASLTVDLGNLYSLGVQGDDGKYSLTIKLDGFSMESMAYEAGEGLIFAEGSWLAQMLGKEANKGAKVSIQSLNEADAATQEAAVASTYAVTYNAAPGSNVGTVIRITGLSVIPEPATTTLGLVALAALVTRRRRK